MALERLLNPDQIQRVRSGIETAEESHIQRNRSDYQREENMISIILDIPLDPRHDEFVKNVLIEADQLGNVPREDQQWLIQFAATVDYSPLRLSILASMVELIFDIHDRPIKFQNEHEYIKAAVENVETVLERTRHNREGLEEIEEGRNLLNLLENYDKEELERVAKLCWTKYQHWEI